MKHLPGGSLLRPSRAVKLGALALAVLLGASACTLAMLHPGPAAIDHTANGSLPPQGVLQVVDISNMHLGSLSWNGSQLTATYGSYEGPGPEGDHTTVDAVEVTTAGSRDPCGPMEYGNGEGIHTAVPSCSQVAPGLWRRGDPGSVLGYVTHRRGVTVALSIGGAQYLQGQGHNQAIPKGADADTFARTSIETAHSLSDAQLNTLFPSSHTSTRNWNWNWIL